MSIAGSDRSHKSGFHCDITITFIDIIRHTSTNILQVIHKTRAFEGRNVVKLCIYIDHFEPATMWVINSPAEYLRMLSVGTQRVVTFHT